MDKSIAIEEIANIFSQSNIFFLMTDREGNILSHTYNVPERIKREKCVVGLDENLDKAFREFIDSEQRTIEQIVEMKTEILRLIFSKVEESILIFGETITEKVLIDNYMNERFETLTTYLEFAPIFFVVLDENGNVSYINTWTLNKTGYRLEEVVRKNWFDVFIPSDIREMVRGVFVQIRQRNIEMNQSYENEILCKDGSKLVALWENKLILKGDTFGGIISVGVDVTDRKIREVEDKVMLELLQASLEQDYTIAFEKIGNILASTYKVRKLTGLVRVPEDSYEFTIIKPSNGENAENSERFEEREYVRNVADRSIKIDIAVSNFSQLVTENSLERIANILFSFIDRIYYIQRLEEASFRDTLTSLFNRRYYMMVLKGEILRVRRYNTSSCVVMIDLDGLKKVNDTLGHDKGDHALKLVAQVLAENIRKTDIPARFGGDEFVLLLTETKIENAKVVIQRIIDELDKKYIDSMKISISAGITKIMPTDDIEGISVMKRADELLYRAKKSGKDTFFCDDLQIKE